MSDTEQRIRERAFQLWEQAGCPHARSEEFWFAARQEIDSDQPQAGPAGVQDDAPGGAIDFPPDERSVEEPAQLSETAHVSEVSGLPGELPATQTATAQAEGHAAAEPDPAEGAAAEAPVPLRSPPPAANSDLRKAAEGDAPARTGAAKAAQSKTEPAKTASAKPAAARPAPTRPAR